MFKWFIIRNRCSFKQLYHLNNCLFDLCLNKLEAGCVELDDGSKFELVEKFCYLGDMLCAGGGAEEASRTRVRSAWGKFNELAPVLTKRGVSLTY